MAQIILDNATVEFPIFNANARSLTSRLVDFTSGGRLDSDPNGHVHVKSLQNISLSIVQGERVGVVGINGSGKSTLLRMLAGIYSPSSGTARIDGTVGSLIDISLGINPEATGRENIFIRGALLGLSRSQVEAVYSEIVEFSELGEFIEMPVRTYSSGMNLRLAFAVSTVIRPEILLMDEWLSVGDESFAKKSKQRLAEIVNESDILVLATHSRELLENTCSRTLWLSQGRIIEDGETSEIAKLYFNQKQ
jgi:lipopolysaccharide transport system ATP-binding protein